MQNQYSEEVAQEIENIVGLVRMILDKLEMQIPDVEDLSFLQNDLFYNDILKIIFKCENFLEAEQQQNYEEAEVGQRLQILIDFLGKSILGMKIEDIKGSEIIQGSIIHIKNLLELILALCNVDYEESERIQDVDGRDLKKKINKSKKKGSKNEDQVEQYEKTLSKKQKLRNLSSTRKTKKISQGQDLLKPKFIDQKSKKRTQTSAKTQKKSKRMSQQRLKQEEKKIIKELKKLPQEELIKLLPIQYRNPLIKKNCQQDIIQTTLARQQQIYQNTLNEYIKNISRNQNKTYHKNKSLKSHLTENQRRLKVYEKSLQQQMQREEQSQYMYLRDNLINYIRKINRVIFEVKKQEQIDQNKQIQQQLQERKAMTETIIKGIESFYKDQKEQLKNQMFEEKINQEVLKKIENKEFDKLKKEIMNEKKQKLMNLVDKWNQQRKNIQLQMLDDLDLKIKIKQLLDN